MAHGAPDHVQMQDVNITDYVDKTFTSNVHNILGGGIWEFVNVAGQGALGLLYFRGATNLFEPRIIIDGVTVFKELLQRCHEHFTSIGSALSDYCGITQYDFVNNKYAMWIDLRYLRSFKQTLVIQISNEDLFACNISKLYCFWKERS